MFFLTVEVESSNIDSMGANVEKVEKLQFLSNIFEFISIREVFMSVLIKIEKNIPNIK